MVTQPFLQFMASALRASADVPIGEVMREFRFDTLAATCCL